MQRLEGVHNSRKFPLHACFQGRGLLFHTVESSFWSFLMLRSSRLVRGPILIAGPFSFQKSPTKEHVQEEPLSLAEKHPETLKRSNRAGSIGDLDCTIPTADPLPRLSRPICCQPSQFPTLNR